MKLLQIGASGRQEEVEVPGVGAAIGDWSSYVPVIYGSSNLGAGGGAFFKYRREGDSVRIRGTITVGTGGSITSTIQWTLPAGLTAMASKFPADSYNYMNVGTATVHDSWTSVSSPYTITYVDGTNNRFQALGQRHDGAWNYIGASNFPMTWAPGDQLFIDMLVPVNEWQANINLAQDFREYACNSSTTTTEDLTSFSNSPAGAFIKPFTPAGTSFIRKRARFTKEIKDSDILLLQISLTPTGDDWILPADISWTRTYDSAGTNAYGIALRRVAGAPSDVDVLFYSKPNGIPGSAWDSTNTQRWRVVKISNGNFAESGSDSYSTTETLTNKKWIDGKPIYRKVINLGSLPNTTTKSVAHGITGATYFLPVVGVAAGGTSYINLPYSSPAGLQYSISINVNGSNVDIVTGVDRSAWTGYAVLEYTK